MYFKKVVVSSIFVMRIYEKSDGAIIFYKEESKMKENFKKGVVVVLSFALVFAGSHMGNTKNNIKADEVKSEGNLADKLTGTWSYWDGSKDVVQSNAMLLDKLPTRANKGVTRWTTDNYDANTGALDIGGSILTVSLETAYMPFHCHTDRTQVVFL